MQAKDVIKLFDHHRHDRMNELQLLMAYAKMGKMDHIQGKLQELVQAAIQERRLSNLEIPETALWVMTFNWNNSNMRMKYTVELDNRQLSVYDKQILNLSRLFTEIIELYSDVNTMYIIYLSVKEPKQKDSAAKVELRCEGNFKNPENLDQKLNLIDDFEETGVNKEEDMTVCTVSWQCR